MTEIPTVKEIESDFKILKSEVKNKRKRRDKRNKSIGFKTSGINELMKRKKGDPLPYSKSPLKKKNRKNRRSKSPINNRVLNIRISDKEQAAIDNLLEIYDRKESRYQRTKSKVANDCKNHPAASIPTWENRGRGAYPSDEDVINAMDFISATRTNLPRQMRETM